MTAFIEIKNLNVTYGKKRVLKDINLTIEEGETLGIIGRSGAGKTILLHVLRGLDEDIPASGSVIYHTARCDSCGFVNPPSWVGKQCPKCGGNMSEWDVDILDEDAPDKERRAIARRVAIMIQRTFALYGDDRVIENVIRALDDINYSQSQIVQRAADLLEQVKLSHRMMHIARDLSGGEKQRVVLARQMAKEPMVLFADEPTGTLDPKTAKIVHQSIINAAKNYNMTVLITSHFYEVISDIATRAVLMDEGEITMVGAPDDVIKEFMKFQKAFEKREYTAGEPILRVKDLRKSYFSIDRGVIKAINNISFEVKEGEIFGIIGVSGAGKTSLSNAVTGNLEETQGMVEVRIGDDWINMLEPGYYARGRAKQYIGLLHQEFDLYPHRTIVDNLTDAIGLEFPAELAERKAIHTLMIAGFSEDRADEILSIYPGELSEGERHRVALAQVLIKEPRMVVLDEPTGTMDPITKRDVASSILSSREEIGETFVIVSHDMEFVKMVCDRAMLMRAGKIVEIGDVESVLNKVSEQEREIMARGP
ncbi:methyl coenzyme M reductase system, component A2 [Methanocella sp. CWC-04]|uniref:Methyl coenzyme M reductase system, component A2 n=1 Tax=Methanooceanicella nereidis TaxID=2052831 RepID=A0AAP2W5P7_9EURY|nr:methyl coenzyme M reductase system, component A2 [Methanocella sp. CWC-04]